ncbi:MAG TPA: Xaa-Pro aminopeptidase [Candidatus Acidoferrales bacterium]|nr:Xaa-Pro aminopeptidase [Candidatus Acidoferrales bacterium]
MRYEPIPLKLFVENRRRLAALLPKNALVVVNANDLSPTNADGSQATIVNSDLFYLTGVEQEQSILVLYPDADEDQHRELLFLREPTEENQLWEGRKLDQPAARELTGIAHIHWLPEFPRLFHRLMCECDHVFLNTNEHKRAIIDVETREARFVADTVRRYPVHDFRRLAPLMHRLRAVKSKLELGLIRKACDLTDRGFRRVLAFTRPGVREYEVEAEFSHEFLRHGGRFAYQPIIGSGLNACCMHYLANDQVCREGELLLLDVAASYANYNSDLTRTIPVDGRFTPRQKEVYNAVLRVLRQCIASLKPGKKIKDWQKEAEHFVERELVNLKLISTRQIKKQDPDKPAFKKYFMHGCGHPIGLDVHDVGLTVHPLEAGWVMTVEPGIYIPEEGFAVRLENDVLVTAQGPVDLMAHIPLEADEIEELMNARRKHAVQRDGKNAEIAAVNRGRFDPAGSHASRV